jgi:ribosomal protein L28
MLIEAGVFKFQIMQSVFYDVDTTSAKNRRSVKLNLENVRSLPRRRENDMRYSAKQLSALATVSYSLKGTVVVIW